eukprot:COSAG05_NODE_22757_length_262_cov_1.042945_2_plen_42_part_01
MGLLTVAAREQHKSHAAEQKHPCIEPPGRRCIGPAALPVRLR